MDLLVSGLVSGLVGGANGVARAARAALDLLLPPRCLACGAAVATHGSVCAACWSELDFITPPMCASCGFPFAYDPGPGSVCGACARKPPDYSRGRSVLRYDPHSRELVIAFKHGDRTDAAPAYGRWMARAGAELLAGADVVAPVPLHRLRLIARRFNQSALLAQAVAFEAGVACVPDLLVRHRRTPSQGALSRAERHRNVRGAFAVRRSRRAALRGRRVVLIDDVMTTGATANACARTLLRGGAASVDLLTLARVVRVGR